jgi:hypothetical protein
LAGTQEWTGLILLMVISTVSVTVGIVLLIIIPILEKYLISKDEIVVLAAIAKEIKQNSLREKSMKSPLKCPKCRRYSIEWNCDRRAFCCLWRDCNWKDKEYKDPGMTKEENKAADILLKKLFKKG